LNSIFRTTTGRRRPRGAKPQSRPSRRRRPLRVGCRFSSGSAFSCSASVHGPGVPFDWRALLNWKVLAAGFAGLLILSAVAGSFVYFRHHEAERIATGQQTAAVPAAQAVHAAAFPDFSIDVKDARGRYRFLQCDVTVEFHGAVELTEDRKVEIRRVIYLAAKKKGPEWIGRPDSGSRFKKDVGEELQSVLGEGTLKNVYLTRFVWI